MKFYKSAGFENYKDAKRDNGVLVSYWRKYIDIKD